MPAVSMVHHRVLMGTNETVRSDLDEAHERGYYSSSVQIIWTRSFFSKWTHWFHSVRKKVVHSFIFSVYFQIFLSFFQLGTFIYYVYVLPRHRFKTRVFRVADSGYSITFFIRECFDPKMISRQIFIRFLLEPKYRIFRSKMGKNDLPWIIGIDYRN